MKKPAELRSHLAQWLPDLKKNPDKLLLRISNGRIGARYGNGHSFEYHYALVLLITDFCEPLDALFVPLIAWISQHQNNLLFDASANAKLLPFEADVIDHDKIDIQITLQLSERVLVRPVADGGYRCEHVADPPLPDLTGPTGWEIYVKGELVATSNPPSAP